MPVAEGGSAATPSAPRQVLHALTGFAAGARVASEVEAPLHSKLLPRVPPDYDGPPSLTAAQYYSAMWGGACRGRRGVER